jgi:hypothetical protein
MVQKVAAITLTQGLKEMSFGRERATQYEPTQVSLSNLRITLRADAESKLHRWSDESLRPGGSRSRTGQLRYLSADKTKTALALNFHELDLVQISKTPGAIHAEIAIGRMSVDVPGRGD